MVGGLRGFVQESAIVLDETSSTSFALASERGVLHLAWTGSDSRLNLMGSHDGVRFGVKSVLPHRSYRQSDDSSIPMAPALAVGPTTGLQLAWTGADRRLNVWPVHLGPQANRILCEKSSRAPALTAWGGGVALAWTGSDRRLNVLPVAEHGGPVAPTWTLPETSGFSPALAAWGSDLVVAWRGSDSRLNLTHIGPAGVAGHFVLPEATTDPPAVAVFENHLVLAWTGADRRVHLLASNGGHVTARTTTQATSWHAPALAMHGGRLILGWTGSDRRLNLSVLRGIG